LKFCTLYTNAVCYLHNLVCTSYDDKQQAEGEQLQMWLHDTKPRITAAYNWCQKCLLGTTNQLLPQSRVYFI